MSRPIRITTSLRACISTSSFTAPITDPKTALRHQAPPPVSPSRPLVRSHPAFTVKSLHRSGRHVTGRGSITPALATTVNITLTYRKGGKTHTAKHPITTNGDGTFSFDVKTPSGT